MITVTTCDRGKVRAGTFDDLKRSQATWAHVVEPTVEETAQVAVYLGMPVDEINNLLARSQRPTLRELHAFSVLVVRSPRDGKIFLTKPIVLAVSKERNDVLTIAPHASKSVERVLHAADAVQSVRFAAGATAILHAILDEITASYFHVFDAMDDELGRIENSVRTGLVTPEVMERIFDLKKTLIYFHKALVGNREVIGAITHEHMPALDAKFLPRFRILHDQIVQLIELGATYRDILTSTLEVHLSVVSNRLNVTMKRLTGWGAIILIPSLIAAIFGMNFDAIPLVHAPNGFSDAVALMGISVVVLYGYFRYKDWI